MSARQQVRKLLDAGTPGDKIPIALIMRMMFEFGGTYPYKEPNE